MSKVNQLLEQIHEEGIRQSLAEEVENLKAATNKADADLDEVNSQVKDVLTRIASALQQEKENAEQVKKQVQQEMLKQIVITPVLRTNQTQLQNLTLKLLATKTNQAIQEILNLLNQLQKMKQQNLLQLLEIKKNQ